MSDVELNALHSFLSELDVNEVDELVETFEALLVSTETIEVDDATSGESSDDSAVRPAKRFKTEEARKRQNAYDKKSRAKKRMNHREACEAFASRSRVNPMLLFITVLLARIEGTTRASTRLRLSDSIKIKTEDGTSENIDRKECEDDAKRQLAMNQVSMSYSKVWTDTWLEHKTGESAKFFLKQYSDDIQPAMNRLRELHDELSWADKDLQQCMHRNTKGVWI
ncbi:hypothetical protein PHYBOEH_010083 [Phytophthora boehmeriae]|uniref:Uncharacterized protein n=1 Tax=Phytophthora boehmeriae TaxID=109152 RepID=A0A8T1VSK3_9STRA|nr:hypothetical protein PHYBOEH_010083 [Phytophthora boehmeriae]